MEMMQDSQTLQALIERVREASQSFPSDEHAAAFSKSLSEISERVHARSDALSPSKFPIPRHALFSDQDAFNTTLIGQLKEESRTVQSLLDKAGPLVRTYCTDCDAVESAEKLRSEARQLRQKLEFVEQRFRQGITADNGEGTRPDLSQPSCLYASTHASYLAMLPTFVLESSQIEEAVSGCIKRSKLAALRLNAPGIDTDYKVTFGSEIDSLDEQLKALLALKAVVSSDATNLRTVRQIWSAMDDVSKSLQSHSTDLREGLVKHRWKQQIGGETAPPTPESPRTDLPSDRQPTDSFESLIRDSTSRVLRSVDDPLSEIRGSLPWALVEHIEQRRAALRRELADFEAMNRLLSNIRNQTSVMTVVRSEVHALEDRIDETRQEYDDLYSRILQQSNESTPTDSDNPDIEAKCTILSSRVDSTLKESEILVASFPTRIPFISSRSDAMSVLAHESRSMESPTKDSFSHLPFDPSTVDRAVRNDSNSFAARLTGGMQTLVRKRSFTRAYRIAKDIDRRANTIQNEMFSLDNERTQSNEDWEKMRMEVDDRADVANASLERLTTRLSESVKTKSDVISQQISVIHTNLDEMRSVPHIFEDPALLQILHVRANKADELNLAFRRTLSSIESLQADIGNAKRPLPLPPIEEDSPRKPFALAPSLDVDDRTPTRKRTVFTEDGQSFPPV